jgi:AraC-like DNA-binding protein
MNAIPLVRSSAILPMIGFLNQNSVPSEKLLRRAKLPIAALANPESLIPLYNAFAFSELVARQEGIELFGVMVSQRVLVEEFGMFTKLACQSLTLYDFLHTISVFLTSTHNSGARVWLTQKGDKVWLNHQYVNQANADNQQAQYYACLLYLKLIQSVTMDGWYATDLHFQAGQLRGLENFEVFSQLQVHFNQPNNAIGFARSLLCLPLKQAINGHLSFQHQDYETWWVSSPATDFVGSARQLVRSYLPDGGLPIAFAAEAAGLSTRSLQRRLAEKGISYSRLIDQVRFSVAVELLKDPSVQLTNVSLELGYTEPATFTRAFQRWTGILPSEFRHLHLSK